MSIFTNFFKPDPTKPEIQDEEKVKTDYNYWRMRILYSTFVGYALFYFTRKSFTFAMPGLIQDLHLDKSQLGFLGTILAVAYGLSKFTSGIFADRSNARSFMAFGLIMTGILNIFFGMSSSLWLFAVFWGLNGWFQGFGWPPVARCLTHWYSHSERGSWWAIWNVSHNVGAFLIPWIVTFILSYWNWRIGMYVPGLICIAGGFFILNRLRDTPQSLGLPPVEKFRNDYVEKDGKVEYEEKELSVKEILFKYVLKNKFIWLLAVANFFVYIVRTGVNDWTALFLMETKTYSTIGAGGCVSLFEVGGFLGSLAAGWSSDYLFRARRGPVNVLYALGMLISIWLFWLIPGGYVWLDSIAMFLIGFAIFGPQMMIGLAAAELSHKKAAATATGLTGLLGYLGAAVAGYPFGVLIETMQWSGFFLGMGVCCAMSILVLLPLWSVTKSKSFALPKKKTKVEFA